MVQQPSRLATPRGALGRPQPSPPPTTLEGSYDPVVGWRVVLTLMMAACGPNVDRGADDRGGTSAVGESSAPTMTTSDGPEASTSSSSSGSNSESTVDGPPPAEQEYEGVIVQPDSVTAGLHFQACGGPPGGWCLTGEAAFAWQCAGIYLHLRGHLVPNPHAGGFDAPCGDQLLHVEEIIEAHESKPSDCAMAALDCATECSIWDQDCGEGQKCVPWAPPGVRYAGTRCAEIEPGAGAPGDACVRSEWPGTDTCGLGSVCTNIDLFTEVGTCTAQCIGSANNPVCPGEDICHIDNGGSIALCFTACDPFADDCPPDIECNSTAGEAYFVCINGPDLFLIDGFTCAGGGDCGYTAVCVPADALSNCDESACCTAACNLVDPVCSPGLVCADIYPATAPTALENVGACVDA
jgi:hypothetical protein